ncbi:type III secretion system protein [Burkholderia sp. WAC0059]|uniref:type III secretion system protein n=1 Tax=Burkholderia sp. WAC0059 TaxID=2066022 RepID=UPI000C7EF499|nr:type III secretion system protein [Burkholderia sp. WAC0059]PLZ00282.1 type III secretion system protein [Burkholderia sp. WAC0059]
MYELLAPVAKDMDQLEATLAAPDSAERVRKIGAALEATAGRVSDATQLVGTDEERLALQKIYRGVVAARSIVLNLHELRQERH